MKGFSYCMVLLLSVIINSGCVTKCNPTINEYFVDEEQLQQMPYNGFDTLTYVRTYIGDTHTFIGAGKTVGMEQYTNSVECSPISKAQYIIYAYRSATFPHSMTFGFYAKEHEYYKNHYLVFQSGRFEGDLRFDGKVTTLDSLLVAGEMYYNIVKIPAGNKPFGAFFDKKYGCIKIVFALGETWELIPK